MVVAHRDEPQPGDLSPIRDLDDHWRWPNDEVAALKQRAVGGDEISLGLVDDLDQIAADNLHYRAVERPALHPDLLDCFGARRL
jgi:hypothetical protein